MNLLKTALRGGLLTAAGLLLSASSEAQTVTLKYNPKPGTKYSNTLKMDMDISMDIQQMPIQMTMNMAFYTTEKFSKGENDTRKMDVKYDRLVYSMSGMGNTSKFDSDKPEEGDKKLRKLGNIVDHPFTMYVNQQGKVVRVEGLQNGSDEEGGEAGISADAARKMMQMTMEVFPDHPVKPGDSWQSTTEYSASNMPIQSKNTYTLVSISGGVALIKVKSALSSPESDVSEGLSMTLSGEQNGEMRMDVASGLILESSLTQTITGEMSTEGNTVPMNMTGKYRVVGTIK